MAIPDSGVKFQEEGNISTPTAAPYQVQDFNEADYKKRILDSQFNGGASKRDQRRFKKYINSDAGKKALLDAEQRHDDSERSTARAFNQAAALINKYNSEFSKIGQETAAYEQNYWNANKDALQKQGWSYTPDANSAWGGKWSKQTLAAPVSTPEPVKPELTPKVDWNAKATQYGFKDMDAVKAWQTENGLVADGKFGKNSLAKYNEIAKTKQQAALVNSKSQPTTPTQPVQPVQETPLLTVDDYKNSKYFRGVHGMSDGAAVTIDGKEYPIFVIQNRYTGSGKSKEENDRTYAVDPETGKMRRVFENWFGIPHNAWSTDPGGEDWFYPSFMAGPEYEWKKANPMPSMRGPLGGGLTQEYEAWLEKYKAAKAAGFKKQGGTMNKVKYFQQGGSMDAQQVLQQLAQGIQNQDPQAIQALQDLATKAANGDQQSMQFLTGVQSLAEKGDQAATIIMNAITQMASAQQTPSAKWGSKLRYIRSLKYAKGGVACPACQAGAAVPTPQDKAYRKPIQKVEEKACGGKAKKAKKRYFGGWL